MPIKTHRPWELPESAATPEHIYRNRREILRGMGLGGIALAGLSLGGCAEAATEADPTADLYPAARNEAFALDRTLTNEEEATTYNNFYEFGSHKNIHKAAQKLPLRPWTVRLDGMVEEERAVDVDTLIRAMPLEERLYRHRCVEAWSMAVPWTGFPLAALVDYAKPLSGAKYVRFETFLMPDVAPGQKQRWYPWPYVEGLTMAEARNELAFIATGVYGKPMPKQNGAPLRLVAPWKYGFKSIKSLVRLHFTDQRPLTFWEEVQAAEYGFWANVNPDVPHPRWSQATERLLGTGERVPTLLYNGYAEQVAGLYDGVTGENLYR